MELYYFIEYAFYNDINNTNGMNKSVYFILFLHVISFNEACMWI